MISYQQSKSLKEAGFPQKRKAHAKYYLTEDYIIDFETAHDIYMSKEPNPESLFPYDGDEEIDWTNSLIYIPTFEDLVGKEQYYATMSEYINNYLEAQKDVQKNAAKLVGEAS